MPEPERTCLAAEEIEALGRKLRAEDAIPLYERVKRHLSERILIGAWPPGTIVPSETILANTMNVAVGTVRRALAELTAEGLISRRRKTGTVVTGRRPHHSLRMTFQYFRLHGKDESLHRSTSTVVSYNKRLPNERERSVLGLDGSTLVHNLVRVRSVGGQPVMRDDITIPADIVPHLHENGELTQSYSTFILERFGVRISAMREKITAELSTRHDVELLAVAHPTAMLVIDEVAFDQGGRAVVCVVHRAVTSEFMYLNEVS